MLITKYTQFLQSQQFIESGRILIVTEAEREREDEKPIAFSALSWCACKLYAADKDISQVLKIVIVGKCTQIRAVD